MSKVVPIFMIIAGAVLIWAAITDRNPIDVTKAVLQRKTIPPAGSLSGASDTSTPGGRGKSGLDGGGSAGGGAGGGGGGSWRDSGDGSIGNLPDGGTGSIGGL